MKTFDYMILYFDPDPETYVVGTADVEPAVSIDHINRIQEGYKQLMEVLGVSALQRVSAAAGIKLYKTEAGELAEQVGEGKEIALTEVTRKLVQTIPIALWKYRKQVTAEAIQASGYDKAVSDTDRALVNKVRKYIKSTLFSTIAAGTGTATGGANLQAACANAMAALQTKYEDEDVTPLFFLNTDDVYNFLGQASLSTQNAFGFSYLKAFLGMGDAIISSKVPHQTVYVTAKENLNCAIPDGGSDVASAMGMTTDESGVVLFKHYTADSCASLETLLMTGATFYAEDLSGVFKATIGE